MKRFNLNANSYKEAYNYILNRTIQLLKYGVSFETSFEIKEGIDVTFSYNKEEYHAIYIYSEYRGKGFYESYVKKNDYKIITHSDCQIESFLKSKNITYICFGDFESTLEYRLIEEVYGDQKSKRSKVYLMNHIDEGLTILNQIGASIEAKKAYCLHPIFQDDETFKAIDSNKLKLIDPKVIINAVEYRSIANDYLSNRIVDSIDDIKLSPLKDVNDMLIADKVQNYKDFEVYHKDTIYESRHPRSAELDKYFKNWLEKLDITNKYSSWSQLLHLSTREI